MAQPDWTHQEIALAQQYVDSAEREGGFNLVNLQIHMCEHSNCKAVKPLRSISRLLSNVLGCTHKLVTVVAAQQDPVKVEDYWQGILDDSIKPEHIVFYDESGLEELNLHPKKAWSRSSARARLSGN